MNNEYDINSFSFFSSYYDAIKNMKPKAKQEFLLAILEFMFEGKEPEFRGELAINWKFVRPNLVKSKNKSNRNQTGNFI